MNHTLTGLGIALILALAAALIGPFFIDWGNHRAAFEAQASKLLGVPVRVRGDVEARLLPSPRIRFGHVVAGDEWDSAKLEAESFSLDLALMPLISGEYRVRNLTVDRAKIKATLAANGELTVPFRAGGMTRADLDRVLIEKFAVTNSQMTLADPAANRSFVLDGVNVTGEASALAGPLKVEGQGVMNGARYELRASTGQFDANGAGRVKITVQADATPALDLDGTLLVGAAPRFAGNAVLAQAGAPAVDGKPAREAWKIRAGIKADPRRVIAETLDVQHGDEGSGMHLAGTGELALMKGVPSAVVDLSARQVDIDRSLGRPKEAPPLAPAAALAAFAERVPAPPASALSLRAKLAVEGVVLAGDIVQNLRAELATAPSGWTVDNLSFRTPGGGDVKTAGALTFEGGPGYSGLFAVDAPNLPTLVHWLEGSSGKRPDIAIKRLKLEGDLAARPGAYALQDFRMTADGADLTGRLAWSGPATGRPKLEARLAADRLDLDALDPSRLAALFGGSGANGTDLEIALKAKQLTYAKTAWKQVDVDLSTSTDGVDVRRLTVADLGGARIEAKGRLAQRNGRPDGKLEAKIEAASLNGLLSVARQSGVPAAFVDQLGSRAQFLAPASLKAVVQSEKGTNRVSGNFTGTLGGAAVDIQASAEPHAIAKTLNGTLKASSQDEARLLGQLGVPVVSMQTGGAANVEASIRNDGRDAASIEGRYAAEGSSSLAFKGALKADGDLSGRVDLSTEDAARYAVMLGRAPEASLPTVPLTLGANVSFGAAGASLDKLAGFVQGRALSGKLDIRDKDGITGEIGIASLSLSELLGAALGPLALAGADEAGWPSGPAGPSLFEGLNGRVAVKAGALELTKGYVAGGAAFTLAVSRNEFAVQDARAVLAGGELKGNLAVRRTDAEASVAARFALTGASLGDLVWTSARPAAVGRVDVTADMLGNGSTLSQILGSLAGSGSATLRDGRLAALDPGAFGRTFAVVENSETPPDAADIATRFQTELLLGDLNVSEMASAFTIGSGVVRAQNAAITASDADVTASGAADLPKGLVAAELMLRPKTFAESGDGSVPQVDMTFAGPLTAPEKRIDTNALATFLTARALEREVKRVEQMEAEKRERERLAAEAEARRAAEEAEAQRIRAITESTGQVPLPALPPPVEIAPRRPPPPALPEQTRSAPRRQFGSPFDIFRRPAVPEAAR